MKKIIFIFGMCLPIFGLAQNKGGYAQLNGNFAVSRPLGDGAGGAFSVHRFINNSTSIGGGFDVIKYKKLKNVSPSIYADLRGYLGSGIKKPLVYFSLTPGYYLYNDSYSVRSGFSMNNFSYSGGFLFGAGFGCILYSGKKTAPFFSAAYNNIPLTFKDDKSQQTTRYNVFKINFGINF